MGGGAAVKPIDWSLYWDDIRKQIDAIQAMPLDQLAKLNRERAIKEFRRLAQGLDKEAEQ
jgi:DNA gyrase/topoisomerase IV subunit A